MTVSEKLRKVIAEIRRKPYPIKDLIPLLDEAATKLEKLEQRELCDNYGRCNCQHYCEGR